MMNRILAASIRLSVCTLLLVACPLFAHKSQPAKIKAAAIEVEMIQSDEIKLPAEFQIALYENLIRQLHKQGFFAGVSRGGRQRRGRHRPRCSAQHRAGFQGGQRESQEGNDSCRRHVDHGSLPVHETVRNVTLGAGCERQGPVLWRDS